jgi:hypothetical protein
VDAQQILGEQDAEHVVAVAVDDREAEWAASMTMGTISASGSSTSMTSICARGIITSVTRVSEAARAPSMMVSASASIRLRS